MSRAGEQLFGRRREALNELINILNMLKIRKDSKGKPWKKEMVPGHQAHIPRREQEREDPDLFANKNVMAMRSILV